MMSLSRQAQTEALSPGLARIINDKRDQAASRQRDLTLKVKALLSEARLFVRGAEIEIRSEDAQACPRRTAARSGRVGKRGATPCQNFNIRAAFAHPTKLP